MPPSGVPRLYRGDGSPAPKAGPGLPLFQAFGKLDDPCGYIADPGLIDAVNVALALGQPLLVAGEPGTGKTQLAASINHELRLQSLLVFNAKTTSVARDLFYRYDSLSHFRDAQLRKEQVAADDYITYEALGLATILASRKAAGAVGLLPANLVEPCPKRSVVLVDEIDKAPRDFPNDILNEVESMSFRVTETGREVHAEAEYRPILVLTSNSDKDLPEAFLRRCVFYWIPFPNADRLRRIVARRLDLHSRLTPTMLDHAITEFERIRNLGLRKKPATAEFLAWVHILAVNGIDAQSPRPDQSDALVASYSILAKNQEDRERLRAEGAVRK